MKETHRTSPSIPSVIPKEIEYQLELCYQLSRQIQGLQKLPESSLKTLLLSEVSTLLNPDPAYFGISVKSSEWTDLEKRYQTLLAEKSDMTHDLAAAEERLAAIDFEDRRERIRVSWSRLFVASLIGFILAWILV